MRITGVWRELSHTSAKLRAFRGMPRGGSQQPAGNRTSAREHGGDDFERAVEAEARARLWDARHSAFLACLALRPGARAFVTDACVPISRLAECVAATIADTRTCSLPCPIIPEIELTYTIEPERRSRMCGASSSVSRTAPSTSTW